MYDLFLMLGPDKFVGLVTGVLIASLIALFIIAYTVIKIVDIIVWRRRGVL